MCIFRYCFVCQYQSSDSGCEDRLREMTYIVSSGALNSTPTQPKAKNNVSAPGCATSRMRPATPIRYCKKTGCPPGGKSLGGPRNEFQIH